MTDLTEQFLNIKVLANKLYRLLFYKNMHISIDYSEKIKELDELQTDLIETLNDKLYSWQRLKRNKEDKNFIRRTYWLVYYLMQFDLLSDNGIDYDLEKLKRIYELQKELYDEFNV